MVGKNVTFIANLAPRKMMGILSQGMILMAEDRDGKLRLVLPDQDVEPGAGVSWNQLPGAGSQFPGGRCRVPVCPGASCWTHSLWNACPEALTHTIWNACPEAFDAPRLMPKDPDVRKSRVWLRKHAKQIFNVVCAFLGTWSEIVFTISQNLLDVIVFSLLVAPYRGGTY